MADSTQPVPPDVERWITTAPLQLDRLLHETEDDGCGAVAIFGGTVRNVNDGSPVAQLWYEAHTTLAAATLARIEAEAAARFGARVRVQHRVGLLALGETSVWVVARSPHRAAAFDAARWALESLKQTAPVWKKEHYADGRQSWLEGTSLNAPAPDPDA